MATQIEKVFYEASPLWVCIVESIVITAFVPVVGFLLHRQDPLFYASTFSWLMAAPLLVGLRYGFIFGLASGAAMAGIMALSSRYSFEAGQLSLQYAIGVILVGMVAGEFTDIWRRRFMQMRIFNNYQTTRLEEFVRNYHLLRVSHDQLAERLAANPHNLRDTLLALSERFDEREPGEDILRRRAPDILSFLAAEGRIQQCALYAVDDQHRIDREALDDLGGRLSEVDVSQHPMVRACVEQRCMISQRSEMGEEHQVASLAILAVIPLVDVDDRVWAVVTITEMPFVVFERGNLHLLAVLGANLGDVISKAYDRWPTDLDQAGREFEAQVVRWTQYASRYNLTSLLMAFEISGRIEGISNEALIDLIFEQLRALDSGWVANVGDFTQILYVLMPLTPERGATAYRERMTLMLQERFGLNVAENGLVFHQRIVDGKHAAADLLSDIRAQAEGRAVG